MRYNSTQTKNRRRTLPCVIFLYKHSDSTIQNLKKGTIDPQIATWFQDSTPEASHTQKPKELRETCRPVRYAQ